MERKINILLVIFAAFVVILGAYTRLTHSGLGCPDWPGCYGQLLVPTQVPYDPSFTAAKAWAEMIHRYAAGLLGSGIIIWAAYQWWQQPKRSADLIILCLLVILQAAFGAFTVTWKLHPLAVMPHLIGGMAITCLLWHHCLRRPAGHSVSRIFKALWSLVFICTILQCICGGWTSANYAALICPDFPYCQGVSFPSIDWAAAIDLQLPIGANHEGGRLGIIARSSIHMLHRYVGVLTGLIFGFLIVYTWRKKSNPAIKKAVVFCVVSFICQATFGILNIIWILPLSIATAHNAIALSCLLALIYLYHQVRIHHDPHS